MYKIKTYQKSIEQQKFMQKYKIDMKRVLKMQQQYKSHLPEMSPSPLGQYLFSILQQVYSSIDHLLDNLSFIYLSHGIKFPIKHHQESLKRLLTPFQLLNQFGMKNCSDIINHEIISKFSSCYQQNDHQPQPNHQGKQDASRFRQRELYPLTDNEEMKKNKVFRSQEQRFLMQTQQKQQLDRIIYRKIEQRKQEKQIEGSRPQQFKDNNYINSSFTFGLPQNYGIRPMLGKAGEQKLCYWVMSHLRTNRRLLLRQVAEQAKIIAKQLGVKNFRACISWVNKFLDRFPELKLMLKSVRFEHSHKQRNKKNKIRKNQQIKNNYLADSFENDKDSLNGYPDGEIDQYQNNNNVAGLNNQSESQYDDGTGFEQDQGQKESLSYKNSGKKDSNIKIQTVDEFQQIFDQKEEIIKYQSSKEKQNKQLWKSSKKDQLKK